MESTSDVIVGERLRRLRAVMELLDTDVVLTADPINIFYASGVRNMTVFSMMGAFRFALVAREGPLIIWEFAGAEHLAEASSVVSEIRTAPNVSPVGGPTYQDDVKRFAGEVADLCSAIGTARLAVERMDHPVTDALRGVGLMLTSATDVFVEARRVKTAHEIDAMKNAMGRVEHAVDTMLTHLAPGLTEIDVWSHFQQSLIASGGEYVSTRLVQGGARTFPYFNEASENLLFEGDLFCIDTDAIGVGGYAVDFSRTYSVGASPTQAQRDLHALAVEQVEHNAALIGPGVTFEAFARAAWPVPEQHQPYGYYCLAHGLGMSGEFPYVPMATDGQAYALPGHFEPGMVMCLESYIGDPSEHQGVKIENQYVVTAAGAVLMSRAPYDSALLGRSVA